MTAPTPSAIATRLPVRGDATTWDDTQLIAALLARCPAAWREFGVRFDGLIHSCVFKVTRRFARVVSADDPGEIVATLRVSLLANDMHKLRSFDASRGHRLSGWIGLLAMNAAYDYLRSLRRQPAGAAMTEASDLPSQQPDPFEAASQRERAQIAGEILCAFSAIDRRFASLYFGQGLPPAAIAERLNISVKTVYSKKHKIQSRLEDITRRAA